MARFDPAKYDAPEIDRRIDGLDEEELRALLSAERLGTDRTAVKSVILDRLAELEAETSREDGEESAEAGEGPPAADREGPVRGGGDTGTDGVPGQDRSSERTAGTPFGPTSERDTDRSGPRGRPASRTGGLEGGHRDGPSPVEVDAGLRLRRAVDGWFAVLVAVLVLTALVGGWLTYTTHVDPGTHVETRTSVVFERTVGFDHGATVSRQNSVFPMGARLADREVYFTAIAPVLDGSVVVTYDSPYGDSVELTTRLTLVTRSVARRGDAETVYWSVSEPLAAPSTVTVAPGETVRTRFAVNVSEVAERADTVRDELGSSPGRTEALVVADLRFAGRVGGQRVDTPVDYVLRIEPGGGTYEVIEPEGGTEAVRVTEREVVENDYGPVRSAGAPALLVVPLVAVGLLLYGRWTGRLSVSEREREALAFAASRSEFDEWITAGRVPGELDEPVVRTDSLEGLVDVAIDTNERVIHDTRTDRYVVLDDPVTYVFERSHASEE